MRRNNTLTFVLVCLLILTVTSCGNLTSKNTGAIMIALPGAEGMRQAGYVPSDAELAKAEYEIILINTKTNRGEKTTATGGQTVVLNNVTPGEYRISITAHVGNGYYDGYTQKNIEVVEGETSPASVSMYVKPRFMWGWNDTEVVFWITRQPEDDVFQDCYLIGDKGISIKPNLDRGDINNENWFGEWPFKITDSDSFYLGGTWGKKEDAPESRWHDNNTNKNPLYAGNELMNKGSLDLPDLSEYNSSSVRPSVNQGNWAVKWKIDEVMEYLSEQLPGEVWCKIGFFDNSGNWITGTHFTCGQPDSIEYKDMIENNGVSIDKLTLYANLTAEKAKELLGNNWYVQCSLFFKPEGENSTWQIELPVRASNEN